MATSFACASRLSSGAVPFVPRHLTNTTPPLNGTTPNCITPNGVTTLINGTTTVLHGSRNGATPPHDSDCGSSSGLGGMKTQDIASDEGASSSEDPQMAADYIRPISFQLPTPAYPPLSVAPPMSWMHVTPPGFNTDLFVHVQPGETLTIYVGNEPQNISGPATVRMVGESGIAPSALPIHVPPGHLVHQIVDEQGLLRHIILAPEVPTAFPTNANYQFYTVDRKYSNQSRHSISEQQDEAEVDIIEPEEYDKVRDMLNRIRVPQIYGVSSREVEVAWQELDTSEASAPGGPFPQIDASEFSYHISIFDSSRRFHNSYKCEHGSRHRIGKLRPNTEYQIQLKAALEGRGLVGEPSPPVSFKTIPDVPEAPQMPRTVNKGSDWISIQWRSPPENGSSIHTYSVYMSKLHDDAAEKVFAGRCLDARIPHLKPSTSYRFRVTATNRLGEGHESPCLIVTTKTDTPPCQPACPAVASVSTRGVRLTWQTMAETSYSIEMHDLSTQTVVIVKDRITTSAAMITDLIHGCEYRFRLQAHNNDGSSPWSDWTSVRMTLRPTDIRDKPMVQERVIVPSTPYIIEQGRRKLEIGWKINGSRDREFTYHLEGSSYDYPQRYRTLYRGIHNTFLLTEDEIGTVRVQSINKRNILSEYSDCLILPRRDEDPPVAPPKPATPIIEAAGKGTLRVHWESVTTKMPSTASVIYEMRRVDGKAVLIFSGPELSHVIEGLAVKQYIEIQVRAVVVCRDGVRTEGDWSDVASASVPRDPPRAPKDLWVAQDLSALHWNAPETSSDLRYRVHCTLMVEGRRESIVDETAECHYSLNKLQHKKNYTCKVSAFHDGGEGESSEEIPVNTPARVPAQPEHMSIEAEGTNVLFITWTAPDSRGEPITHYEINVESSGQFVRTTSLPATSDSCEHRITELEPDTSYRIEVRAHNSIGISNATSMSARTKQLPPTPPRIDAECDATMIRLRWKPPSTHSLLTYRLVRLNEVDHQSVIYEGDACSFKCRGLSENTEYRFQIRSADRQTGAGPWSEVHSYKTGLLPPPAVKTQPTATPSGSGFYQIEWTSAITKPNTRKLFYRLQVMDCSIDNAKWITVYEGGQASYTLRASDFPSAVQARVLCVRPEEKELISHPSPIVYIANQNNNNKGELTASTPSETARSGWNMSELMDIPIGPILWLIFALVVAAIAIMVFKDYANSTVPVTPTPKTIPPKIPGINNI